MMSFQTQLIFAQFLLVIWLLLLYGNVVDGEEWYGEDDALSLNSFNQILSGNLRLCLLLTLSESRRWVIQHRYAFQLISSALVFYSVMSSFKR